MLTLLAIILVCLTGLTVSLVVRALAFPRLRAEQRMEAIAQYGFEAPVESGLIVREESRSLIRALGQLAARRADAMRMNQMRQELQAAGMYSVSPQLLLGWRIVAAVLLPPIFWLAAEPLPQALRVFCLVLGMAIGWMLPLTLVRMRGRTRLDKIDLALPELIDLLVVTMETGLSFSGAMQTAAGRLRGPLAEEVRLTLQEEQMGRSMSEALGHMLERVDIPSMRTFVRSIVQAETLGVSVGQILRNLALEMRKTRRAAAEERAQKAATKMLFPLVFLIFPSLGIVILGPALAKVFETLGGGA